MEELHKCIDEEIESEAEMLKHDSEKHNNLQRSFVEYDQCVKQIMEELDNVIHLQEEIVSTGGLFGGLLSASERKSIQDEVAEAKKIFNLHVRDDRCSNDLKDIFDPMLFQKLVTTITAACPTITNILEQLVLTSKTQKNVIKTSSLKMKAAVHLLAALLDVRDQSTGNDIPVLFGLLCICYGAGPAVIRVLQRLGLTESFQTL